MVGIFESNRVNAVGLGIVNEYAQIGARVEVIAKVTDKKVRLTLSQTFPVRIGGIGYPYRSEDGTCNGINGMDLMWVAAVILRPKQTTIKSQAR